MLEIFLINLLVDLFQYFIDALESLKRLKRIGVYKVLLGKAKLSHDAIRMMPTNRAKTPRGSKRPGLMELNKIEREPSCNSRRGQGTITTLLLRHAPGQQCPAPLQTLRRLALPEPPVVSTFALVAEAPVVAAAPVTSRPPSPRVLAVRPTCSYNNNQGRRNRNEMSCSPKVRCLIRRCSPKPD